jgi:hypothetical protein
MFCVLPHFVFGCAVTVSTYDAACNIIQSLAGSKLNGDLRCLVGVINPFFLIYACADCNVPLPKNFDRELFWKHLDGIIRAKCWRGLCQTRANTEYDKSANADNVRRKIFQKGEHDQDDTLQSLIRISCGGELPRTVHRLQITIQGYKWVARADAGTVWYRAGDLYDDDDIACFAVIDCLTRFLPSYEGGILEICSRHVPLLWGVGGEPEGAWSVVRAICEEYQVKLRVKWTELEGPAPSARITSAEADVEVPPRKCAVVDAVMNKFTQNELGSKAAYRLMMGHLQRDTTKT